MKIAAPVNEFQQRFNDLCDVGGGPGGGPSRVKVQQLLHDASHDLNAWAEKFVTNSLAGLASLNPWHICYAMGLTLGHLALEDATFIEAAASLMKNWNAADLAVARSYHWYKGPDPLEQSLSGGWQLFNAVRLPDQLPSDFRPLYDAQQRWLCGLCCCPRLGVDF